MTESNDSTMATVTCDHAGRRVVILGITSIWFLSLDEANQLANGLREAVVAIVQESQRAKGVGL